MTAPAPAVPVGFASVFPGWNVWSLYQADTPDQSILGDIWTLGESQDRLLQVWVENQLGENAGVSVADPMNPAALRGDQIQVLPSAGSLVPAMTRALIPALAGALQVGTAASGATLRTVRFYNRAALPTVIPWPHDQNFVLDTVYLPSAADPLTSGPAPTSLAGAATAVGAGLREAVTVIAWGAGAIGALLLLQRLTRRG